jgi:hypothetical protein
MKLHAERRFGREGVAACLADLSADDCELLESIVPVGWYPLEPALRFSRCVDQRFGSGDLALCREAGRFSAEWQLSSFHKMLLRLTSPGWMFERGLGVWQQYHDSGRWEILQPSTTELVGRLYDFAVVDRAFCVREHGWFERAIELTGGDQVVIEEPRCRAQGAECCEYVGRWRAKTASP